MRETTLRDVAQLAGVSPRTVSNVVNSPDLVSAATRDAWLARAGVRVSARPTAVTAAGPGA